jgi:hypothetical protein
MMKMESIFEEEVQTTQPDTEKFWADMSDVVSEEEVDLAPPQKPGSLMIEESIHTDILY